MNDYARGYEAATRLYNRGYRWSAIRQFMQSHKNHESKGFVEGMKDFLLQIQENPEVE